MIEAYQALERLFARIYEVNQAIELAGWDEQTYMPIGAGAQRASMMGTLAGVAHELLVADANEALFAKAAEAELSEWQSRNFLLMQKRYRESRLIPTALVEQFDQARKISEQAWRASRDQRDWQTFLPHLEKVFVLAREIAEIKSEYSGSTPYDCALDEYSPGVNTQLVEQLFDPLEAFLKTFIPQISAKQAATPLLQQSVSKSTQAGLCEHVMRAIGFDFERGRLDTAMHPFCGGVGDDIRITTSYDENDFTCALMGVCHETGHALYELQLPKSWRSQPIGQSYGMALHESQSLLIEMQACRSEPFLRYLLRRLEQTDAAFKTLTWPALLAHYRHVTPSFIRIHADEVTYPMHIILRFNIEKALFDNRLTIKELPNYWNDLMQQYLGISPNNNHRQGVMQDVHWASGAFGYFPAYTLGAIIAAQLYRHAQTVSPQLDTQLAQGDFSGLRHWLAEHVHQYGSRYSLAELLENATGKPLAVDDFIDHLKARYQAE